MAADADALVLPPMEGVDTDAAWISGIVRFWLDEEWTPLSAHAALGDAAAAAYTAARRGGAEDMGDLVLEMSDALTAFDYHDTFVNAFDVANKVVELLMMRAGTDVCCASEGDRTLIKRYEAAETGRKEPA